MPGYLAIFHPGRVGMPNVNVLIIPASVQPEINVLTSNLAMFWTRITTYLLFGIFVCTEDVRQDLGEASIMSNISRLCRSNANVTTPSSPVV